MLHRRIGERLEALFAERLSDVAPELALHFEEGSDWSRAVRYLRLMAETAGRRYAPREGVQCDPRMRGGDGSPKRLGGRPARRGKRRAPSTTPLEPPREQLLHARRESR